MNIVLFREGEASLPLSDPRCQHILKVLGMKEGDSFKAGFANGMMGMARIESIGDSMSFSFDFREDGSYLHPLTAIIALVRPICMKRILRCLASDPPCIRSGREELPEVISLLLRRV